MKGVIEIEFDLNASEMGKRIKKKLTELNLKQTDLVELTGISKTAISNYILGNRIPDTKSIFLISNSLNISIEWILTGKENINDLSKEEKKIIEKFRQLDTYHKNVADHELYKLLELQNSKININKNLG